jgi:diguanylate cyclase (GGDEF)-like protein
VNKERKIEYWNKSAEDITGYLAQDMVGKYCYDGILRHVDDKGTLLCHNGCPLQNTIKTEEHMEQRVYLHHKMGYRVPVIVKSIPKYDNENNIIGATDQLTKAYNRYYVDYYLDSLIEEYNKFQISFGILFFDIDHFKNVNDTYGHDVGDLVLQLISSTVMGNIRVEDRLGRFGGEEFILMVKISNSKALKHVAEKLRMLIEHSSLHVNGETIHVTCSIGGLMYDETMAKDDFIKKADSYMYQAKGTGRNKSIIEGE